MQFYRRKKLHEFFFYKGISSNVQMGEDIASKIQHRTIREQELALGKLTYDHLIF